MEQLQHGFSDSTPRAGSNRLQKSAKSLLSALKLMSIISQISTRRQKVWVWSFRPFLNRKKKSSNRRTSKESFWFLTNQKTSGDFEIILLDFSKELIFLQSFLTILQLIILKAIYINK